jgi:hypothetical protein
MEQEQCIRTQITEEVLGEVKVIIGPALVRDVRSATSGRYFWRRASDAFETASKVLSGAASILAFAAGAYDMELLSFCSGCVGTSALVLMTLASFAAKESRERTQQLNTTLAHIGLGEDTMPTIAVDPGTGGAV